VTEGGWLPGCGGVAAATVRAKLTVMSVIRFMAGIAVRCSAFENVVWVTAHAGDRGVCTG
jgi:hypothetical protein